MRAAVALQRRDAHLGHHLENALVERFDVVLDRLVVRDAAQQRLADHVVVRLEREVRVDDPGAVPEEQRAMMHFARVARFDDQGAARPRAFADEVMVHARRRQQARDRGVVAIDAAVRQDQDVVAGGQRIARPALQPRHRPLEPGAVLTRVERHRQREAPEAGMVQVPECGQLVVVDHRVLDLDLVARLRTRIEQVPFGPDRRRHRRDELFADGVERRIGHLRERLREVVVQQPWPIRQHRERGVRAHRSDGLFAASRHRREQDAQVFVRVAEGLLPAQDRLVTERREVRRGRQVIDVDEILLEPPRVGLRARQFALDLLVRHDPSARGIDEEDAARVQALLDQHVLGRDVEDADFRRHNHEVVLRYAVARRPQAVAIEHGADHRPVGERDRRRAVPRLHQRRVVLVKRPELGAHALVPRPGLRDHHQDRVW